MGRPSILDKLDQALRQDISTEGQVVYILVEIRKLIEQDRELREYFALDFYCSFALHTVMDREGARRILERFDRAHPLLVSNQPLPTELKKEIQDTTKLAKFREQLEAFITSNGLPDKLF